MVTSRRVLVFLLCAFAVAYSAECQTTSDLSLVIPYTLNNGGFSTEILLHNQRVDISCSGTLSMLGSTENLASVTLSPKETRVIPITTRPDMPIVVRYTGAPGSVSAAALIVHRRDRLSWRVPAVRRDLLFGRRYAAVMWDSDVTADALIAVVNASSQPRTASVYAAADGQQIAAKSITLQAFQSVVVDTESFLPAERRRGVVGLKVEHDGAPGDIIADGVLMSRGTGFAKRISFQDLAHGEHDRRLRAQFVLLGPPPEDFGFLSGATFQSMCAIYNPSAAQIAVEPLLRFSGRSISLPQLTLDPNSTRLLDLGSLQRNGVIPADVRHAALELPYSQGSGRIVAELTDLDISSGYRYNVGSSMPGHLSEALDSAYWRAGDAANTLIAITNAERSADVFELTVRGAGSPRTIPIRVDAGETALLNVRQLQDSGAWPDVRQGSFSARGSHGVRSSFYFEQLLVNATPSQIIDADDEMSDLDGGSDVRVMSVSADGVPPPDGDPSPYPTTVTFGIDVMVRWSDGSAASDSGTTFGANDSHLTADEYSQSGTAYVDGSDWSGYIFVFYIDPCNDGLMFSASFNVSIHYSAYVYNGMIAGPIYDQCLWQATCTGRCSTSGHVSTKVHGLEPCFDPGQPYLQFTDLLIGSNCLRKVFGFNTAVPGFCS